MRTYKDARSMAKSLRGSLAAGNIVLSHSKCLEIVARQLGFADWNTLAARLNADAARPDSVPASMSKAPEQVSCSFCEKSPSEVRSLIEGRCGSPGSSSCVFICDECVALCTQINADTLGDVASPMK